MDQEAITVSSSATSNHGLLTISEVSIKYKLTLRALRFYEARKLIEPRRIGSTRLYDSVALKRLEMILKGKQLGFTLAEIRELLRSTPLEEEGSADFRLAPDQVLEQIDLLNRQRSGIDRALAELEATRQRMEMDGLFANSPARVSQDRDPSLRAA